ncbi:MAG: DEAD/DEAH box helicase [Deltaproteobacteria bacterium]|nr:DEAD/DEAH box helicase [Deltaproteobacteria bacterium]
MSQTPFHPLVERWFAETFAAPTAPQRAGWREIAAGRDTLIAAPTGSGKTLAAFLWAVNRLVEDAAAGRLTDRVRVVYVSPLKALGNDVEKNLQAPLGGVRRLAAAAGVDLSEIRVAVRSGDTPAHERQLQARRPPHILITTPESLYILLTADRSRQALAEAETVIVDEIHAVAADKRGAHLALSLERFDALAARRLQRIGLSATQNPIEDVARLLVGAGRCADDGRPGCAIVDAGHRRELDLSVATTDLDLGPIAVHELRAAVYERIVDLVGRHRTTIVFVNTRRLVERVAHELTERLGEGKVAAHHGSLSRKTRLAAEEGLKSGAIPVVVATASLELGIDVGHVDLVCHLGAPRSLATLVQRVGRSGHFLGAVPKGILFPLTRDELVQCAAAVRAVRRGELDRLTIPENPLDILAQQIVATAAAAETDVEALFAMVRRAHPFRRLERRRFEQVLDLLADGVVTRRGRRSAHLHLDRVHGRVRGRRGARLAAITGGGAIPDTADYDVVEEPAGTFVGKVNEDFAIESMAGDIFLLGNRSWRLRRVEAGRVRVVDAEAAPPTIPFWLGEAPARTAELSAAVAALRREVAERLGDGTAAAGWLIAETGVDTGGAQQIVRYVAETLAALGAVPTLDTLIAERFFDEAGGQQLVLHAPFGGRINRALGLALRKRFCLSFDFELQAAATDDGVVLSLGEQHSFPLPAVFSMVRPATFEKDLVQAALRAPMFTNRWRWNATRALALARSQGGQRVPIALQRMRAEDLLAAVFPAQLACGDNGPRLAEPPDHPLVRETLDNCLHEAMDAAGLRRVLEAMEGGTIRCLAVETPAPSPMSHEILNANPYAFLDDAPLEERRARAVSLRRTDPDLASGLGSLDPAAIDEVCRQAWPAARDADEVHDALLTLWWLPEGEAGGWRVPLDALIAARRVGIAVAAGRRFFVAAERAGGVRAALPDLRFSPEPAAVDAPRVVAHGDDAFAEIVRGWMSVIGPTGAEDLARRLTLPRARIDAALGRLEGEGQVLRGSFRPGSNAEEWCERGLLARIHRLTLGRLRREIEAVSAADFVRFLLHWQHAQPGARLHGRDGVLEVIRQLEGLELPGPAWERDVLPARIAPYDPSDLEDLCLAGEVAWGRLRLAAGADAAAAPTAPARRLAPTRSAPLAFVLRQNLDSLLEPTPPGFSLAELSPIAAEVHEFLARRGASFLAEVARGVHRLPNQVEDALWELVASGLVTGDGIAGLRTLLLPEGKRQPPRRHLRALPARAVRRAMPVGRWALLRGADGEREDAARAAPREGGELAEAAARRLLRRYGVLVRELCARERHAPPWRALLPTLRRLEARGERRGGGFVAGLVGEQFALPEAVAALRALRRHGRGGEVVVLGAADPLNLVGIVLPGARLSPYSGQVVAYRDGAVVEVGELGAVRSRLQGG